MLTPVLLALLDSTAGRHLLSQIYLMEEKMVSGFAPADGAPNKLCLQRGAGNVGYCKTQFSPPPQGTVAVWGSAAHDLSRNAVCVSYLTGHHTSVFSFTVALAPGN